MSSKAALRALLNARRETRQLTLDLLALADDTTLRTQLHPDFSPIGWHFGHIALFEARWIVERTLGQTILTSAQEQEFDPGQLRKPARGKALERDALLRFARTVHDRATEGLPRANDLSIGWMVVGHEQQHAETIATILRMRSVRPRAFDEPPADEVVAPVRALHVKAENVRIGDDNPLLSWDNERPSFRVALEEFLIDDRPATNADWLEFIDAGGYSRPEWWSAAGWDWRCREGITHPFTWERDGSGYRWHGFSGDRPLPQSFPVEGISAFEAEAYARFRGGRLPTEFEWEAAARAFPDTTPRIGVRCGGVCPAQTGQFIGNVWEWTASTFAPYPGFAPGAYAQYSVPYFDGQHRVLRGGSWATQSLIARPSFRDWYPPHWRAIFAGARCVRQ